MSFLLRRRNRTGKPYPVYDVPLPAHKRPRRPGPGPLPYVDLKAVERVSDFLPPPEVCRYCSGPVRLAHHRDVYSKKYGDWPYVYWCVPCEATVGLHPQTDIPLGTLAKKPLRTARRENKALFHELIARKMWPRSYAYQWLALRLEIPVRECHWGWFDEDRCLRAGETCMAEMISEEM